MFRKIASSVLALILLLSLASCGKSGKSEAMGTGYILTNYHSLPDSITKVSGCYLEGERLYLCCWEEADKASTDYYVASICSDGTDFQRLPLEMPNHAIPLDISPDNQGGLWVLLMIPNGEDQAATYSLCRFDGKRKMSVERPLNDLLAETGAIQYVGRDLFLGCDNSGNLCIVARDGRTSCFLFGRDGNYLFTLTDNSDPQSVISLASGQLAVYATSNGGGAYFLMPIDIGKQSWGEQITIGTAANVFSGSGSSDYYLYDSSCFYGCTVEDNDRNELFNWSSLGLVSGDTHVCALPEGRFAVVAGTYSQTQLLSYEFCIVEPGEDNRIVLTMLSLQPDSSLLEAIALFNKSNDEYRVELTSYFSMNEDVSSADWDNALTRLNTAMIAGDIPDLLDLNHMPVEAYSRRGLLEDLYPYLLNDPHINMDDYYANVFTAISIDGKLPYVTSSVRILSVFADTGIVGSEQGWTLEEFVALKNSGHLKMEFFPPTLLLKMIIGADNRFVDWDKGECSFDSEEFANLLELCLLQAEADLNWIDEDGLFEGQANCIYISADSVIAVAYYNALLGGQANPIGIPNPDGNVMHIIEPANRIGFSSTCKHKDGAWAFVRSFLEPRLQESGWYFPFLKSSFEKICQEAVNGNTIWIGGMFGNEAGEADIALARELISTANYCLSSDQELTDLVVSMSGSYFAGGENAMETATEIQSRARLYVGERY